MFGNARPQQGTARRMSSLYAHVSVEGAAAVDTSGHELVALLFDGLLGAIARARGALKSKDVESKVRAIDHALRIVGDGLRSGLNLKEGGQLARDLNDLYTYIELRLMQANLRNDDTALAECAMLLKTLQQAWNDIAPQVRRAA